MERIKEAVAALQVEALRNLPAPAQRNYIDEKRREMAVDRTALVLGVFRKCDADDPQIFSLGLEDVLSRYDVEIQKEVTRSGLWEFPPTPFELKKACDAIANAAAAKRKREENFRAQLEERERINQVRAAAPSSDQLKAKHGENYGLQPGEPDLPPDAMAANRRRAEWSLRAIEREYAATGREPVMAGQTIVSLSLVKLIRGTVGSGD